MLEEQIICGAITSGCIRASATDAFSYNYIVSVVEDCTFDRGIISHKVNLFDLNAKYADVVTLKEILKYIHGLPENLYMNGRKS